MQYKIQYQIKWRFSSRIWWSYILEYVQDILIVIKVVLNRESDSPSEKKVKINQFTFISDYCIEVMPIIIKSQILKSIQHGSLVVSKFSMSLLYLLGKNAYHTPKEQDLFKIKNKLNYQDFWLAILLSLNCSKKSFLYVGSQWG